MTRIQQLTVENFKKLKFVDIKTDEMGNVIVLKGRNGQGKSSIIDSMMVAMGGPKVAPDDPVRHGQKDARIVATLDDGTKITREFFGDGNQRLTLIDEKGHAVQSPQAWLNKLMSTFAFEPQKFIVSSSLERVRLLYDLVGLTESEELRIRDDLIASRIADKRIRKNLAERLSSMPKWREIEEEAINFSKTMEAILEVTGTKIAFGPESDDIDKWDWLAGEVKNYCSKREDIYRKINVSNNLINELEDKLKRLKEENKELQNIAAKQYEFPLSLDFERLAEAGRQQAKQALKESALRSENEHCKKEMQSVSQGLDKTERAIAEIEEAIKQKIEVAFGDSKFAIDDDLCVLDIPFSQLSQSEKLFTAIEVALVQNPTLRVVRLSEGSLFDNATRQKLEELADKHDFQVWLEVVSDDKQGSSGVLIIEDGEILGDHHD